MSNEVIRLIKKSPMFYDLLDKEVEQIIIDCRIIEYKQSNLILAKDAKIDSLIIVVDGEVELQRADGKGLVLGPGSLFGELILLNDDVNAANIKAKSETVHVLEIPYYKIHQFYAEDIRTYGILMANLAKMLAKRLKKAGDYINKLNSK